MRNNIFNQLMELFEDIEANLIDQGDAPMAEAFRQKLSKIVDPLNDQLIDWRLDPEPEPDDSLKSLVVARGNEPPLPGPAVSAEDRAAARAFLEAQGIGADGEPLLVMPLNED